MNEHTYKAGEIKNILEKIYNDPETRRTVVPLFMSNSGLGKTYIIEEFMKEKGVYRPPMVLSQRMPFEISGMAMIEKKSWIKPLAKMLNYFIDKFKSKDEKPFKDFLSTLNDEDTKRMTYYDFDFLLELKDGDILFIDETYSANPNTLSAFLTFLESRIMISGKKLPDIMIIAAANPQGVGPLTPQIKRRFLQYNITFDANSWQNFMFKKYLMPKQVSSKLCGFIKAEDFKGTNYNTPADLDKAVGMVIKDIPTPYEYNIKPILNTFIENKTSNVVDLKNKELKENELISWLDLIRIHRGIDIPTISKDSVKLYNVYLSKINDNKLHFVKMVKELLDCSLIEAKNSVDNIAIYNIKVAEKVTLKRAKEITNELEGLGAVTKTIESIYN